MKNDKKWLKESIKKIKNYFSKIDDKELQENLNKIEYKKFLETPKKKKKNIQ